MLRGVDLDLDNAPTPNAKCSRQEIAGTKVVHPASSTDASSSDFFLFGSLKGEMGASQRRHPQIFFLRSAWSSRNLKRDPHG
jgi:hypothetical protein